MRRSRRGRAIRRPTWPTSWRATPREDPRLPAVPAARDWTQLWDNITPGRTPGQRQRHEPLRLRGQRTVERARVPAVLAVGRARSTTCGALRGELPGAHRRRHDPHRQKWPAGVALPNRPSPFRALSWSLKFPRYHRWTASAASSSTSSRSPCQGFNTRVGSALFERAGIPAAHSAVRAPLRQRRLLPLHAAHGAHGRRLHQARLRKGTPGDLFKSVGGRWDEGPFGYSDERPLEPYCGYTSSSATTRTTSA